MENFMSPTAAYKEISDKFWEKVEPLLEKFKRKKSGGSQALPFRAILNGIFYVLKTGGQWGYVPACYGSKSTVHEHYQKWVAAGVFSEVFRLSVEEYDELVGIEWEWQMMDGFLVQAPVRGQKICLEEEGLGRNPTDRGRSGGKVHLHVDQNGIPTGVITTGANVHDSRLVSATLAADIIPRPQPTTENPQNLCLDKGYDYKRVDKELEQYFLTPHIRRIGEEKVTEEGKTHPARRWVVERTNAWLKGFRAIRTRYFRYARNYLGILHFACALIIFRKIEAL